MECPMCKVFPVSSYILTAKLNFEPVSNEHKNVCKLRNKNPYPVNRIYEVFELFPVSTVHHIDDHLYSNNYYNGVDIVNKLIQFESATIRDIKPAPLTDRKKINKLLYDNALLKAKMLQYKAQCEKLKHNKLSADNKLLKAKLLHYKLKCEKLSNALNKSPK